MSEHLNRKKDIFYGALPPEGTQAYDKIKKMHAKRIAANPSLNKVFKDKYEQASKTLYIQSINGINLNIDKEIRHFLSEFNGRAWEHGLVSMPLMFNILEGFFSFDKSIIYFELLPEEDYLISFYDFLDWYTSGEFSGNIESIKGDLVNDLIFHFNVGVDINEITFKSDNGEEFVIGGVSMIRRGDEVIILFQAGQIINTSDITNELKNRGEFIPSPGREKLKPHEDYKLEAVKLNNDDNSWKTLIACRLDLDTGTINGRIIAKDIGQAFDIITDDISGFLEKGEFISEHYKEAYKKSIEKIGEYNSVFELAKTILHLPSYLNYFEDKIIEESHDTLYKDNVKGPQARRQFRVVDDRFKLLSKQLFILNRNEKFSPDKLEIKDSNFKIEIDGYWKSLKPDEFGLDKKGHRIMGKTWVIRKDSYYEGSANVLIVETSKREFSGPNAGYIYVMRNPIFPENVFKVGLTTNETKERANQLSKTSVPDRFYVMREWAVADCKKAEKQIHDLLKIYRVDERREFFMLDMQIINRIVQDVVDEINENEQ